MQAQTKHVITGVYQLHGVMEMASAILLKEDSSFEFYFSYGAMDRGGIGKWQWNEKDSTIVLNTPNRHGSDYSLFTSRDETGDTTTFRIAEQNSFFLRYTRFRIYTETDTIEGGTDEQGIFTMPRQPVKKIELVFELCPERSSTIEIKDSTHNYFEFRMESWIMDVYFNNVIFKQTEEGLTGGHPLLEGHEYDYRKLD